MKYRPAQAVSIHSLPKDGHPLRLLIELSLTEQIRDAFALKITLPGDAVPLAEAFCIRPAQRPGQFIGGQHVIFPLCALAVRVLAAAKAALGAGQFPQHIVQRAADDLRIKGTAGMLECLRVGQRQQGVVVEHFFKVGNQPAFIGGVPGEPAAHMVEQPAPVHGVQSLQRHLPGVTVPGEAGITQQKNQVMGCGELGRRAKPAPLRIKALDKLNNSPLDELPAGRTGLVLRFLPQVGREGFPGGQHPCSILPP